MTYYVTSLDVVVRTASSTSTRRQVTNCSRHATIEQYMPAHLNSTHRLDRLCVCVRCNRALYKYTHWNYDIVLMVGRRQKFRASGHLPPLPLDGPGCNSHNGVDCISGDFHVITGHWKLSGDPDGRSVGLTSVPASSQSPPTPSSSSSPAFASSPRPAHDLRLLL